ncbi:Polysaccharide export protein [Methylophilaceae bacterium]
MKTTALKRLLIITCMALSSMAINAQAGGGLALSNAQAGGGLALSPELFSAVPKEGDAPGSVNQMDAPSNLNTKDRPANEKALSAEPALQDRVAAPDSAQFKSEFQDFVTQSIGKALPMYGYELFRKAPDTFSPVNNIPVTPDYTIGPGDELLVNIWGQVEADQKVVVDRNGMINLPKVGQVSVVGVRYQNLSAHLKTAIGRMFKNFELDVSLGKLRSIQVFVVGQAARPGNYTVSSLSTLVNAIFASGGPSVKGSMRHIQLKRSGKVVTEFDMYDLLIKGDKSKDVQLLSGDVIYIPPVGAMAAVSGSVNVPAIFELKDQETLAGLLNLAGGLTNVAAGQKVTVERIHKRSVRKMDEFLLDSLGLAKTLQDGDLVTVRPISAGFENAVTLRGNVAGLYAGRHPWKEGLRITDIIPNRAALLTDSYWVKQNQSTQTNDNGWSDQNQNMPANPADPEASTLRSHVTGKVAEINWDYAAIERLDRKELTTKLIPFNLAKAMAGDAENNLVLQSGDVVTLFSKDDIQAPVAKRNSYVILEGELASPGLYQTLPGETLRQLVERIGGLSPQAYLIGSEFTREATRKLQQKRLNEILVQMEAEIQRTASRRSSAAMSREAADAALAESKAQSEMLAKMKKVKASGRIVLEMPEYAVELKNLPDLVLEDGDRLFIPSAPSTVSVMGTVYNQNAFIYKKGQTVSDYLNRAGGPTRDGDDGEIYLIRADGSVFSKRQGTFFFGEGSLTSRKAMPGDTIVVPEKLERYNLTKGLLEWTQVFYQFAIGVASMKTIGVF